MATFKTGSCKQPTMVWLDDLNLPADSASNLEDRQSGNKNVVTQYNKGVRTNLDRLAVVVYFPVLINPQAVNVGVQYHLQGILAYLGD